MKNELKYYDYCGWYTIKQKKDGDCVVMHRLASRPDMKVKVGVYTTLRGAKIALAKYCGGMPNLMAK